MITITPTALQEIQRIQNSRQQKNSYFRISVKDGGCSGLIYSLNLEKTSQENDHLSEYQGLKVIIDPKTLPLIENLKLDYSEDLMGGGFRFQNPQAQKNCNCGQSFSLNN
jgi:iron-sulfur cluster assembly accessory protein